MAVLPTEGRLDDVVQEPQGETKGNIHDPPGGRLDLLERDAEPNGVGFWRRGHGVFSDSAPEANQVGEGDRAGFPRDTISSRTSAPGRAWARRARSGATTLPIFG